MKLWLRLTSVILICIGLLALAIRPTSAAPQTLSFTTSPVSLGINVKPGQSTSEQLKLMNNGDQAVPIIMQVKDFGADGSTGQATITDFRSTDPASKYIKFSPSTFTAQPHVWSYVTATIALPKSAQLGFYYAIVFQPSISIAVGQGQSAIKGDNAILMLIDTGSANETRSVEVAKFTVNKGLFEYLPANFNVNLRNNGNIFIAPVGDIFISRHADGTGTIDTIPVNSGGGNVLPDSNRVFPATWSDGFPVFVDKYVNGKLVTDKKSNPVLSLKWDTSKVNKFRFGRYYAKLALQYNNGKEEVLLRSVVSFWVIPWKILLILAVILLIVLFGIFMFLRGIYRRIKKRGKKKNY
jgi:hypothetical protein